ncbi:hypothetical protein [Streptomyces sp. CL12-4]|uniref:hypothetical protein n=1 Tax=Streptomyces sp. CL12-4 TaxID=2810306 RepID=UPI001EFC1A43|nr:hypothetical protein [Streptomyces sp. CL12-4]MCG8971847.1 hypothetical protein [Streptomyces sp. CL12-4]
MAKYTVTRKCGHDERVDLIGPHRKREQTLEWMEGGDCYACVEAQREKENAESAAAAKVAGWPVLTGTERQVAWAETLRVNAVEELRGGAAWWSEKYPEAPGDPLPFIETAILAVESASWWIDNRHDLVTAGVSLAGADVAESLGLLEPLARKDLGPHVVVRPVIELPSMGSPWMGRKVRVAVCSCGWEAPYRHNLAVSAAEHVEGLDDDVKAEIRRAHPQDEPHACTEALGLRRCVMRPFLRE